MTPPILVIAKAPVPGLVKTRLCPPCTHEQAAAVAEAALCDTIDAVNRTASPQRVLVLSGDYPRPAGWSLVRQRGTSLGERLAHAFGDAGPDRAGGLLIGMDTPQVTPELLGLLGQALDDADAVLGPAADGGWWALGLRDTRHARALAGVPMSTADTGRLTEQALRSRGLRVTVGPVLRDVDTASDAHVVARHRPGGRFAAAVAAHVPIAVMTEVRS